jgi:hypothetical protein
MQRPEAILQGCEFSSSVFLCQAVFRIIVILILIDSYYASLPSVVCLLYPLRHAAGFMFFKRAVQAVLLSTFIPSALSV